MASAYSAELEARYNAIKAGREALGAISSVSQDTLSAVENARDEVWGMFVDENRKTGPKRSPSPCYCDYAYHAEGH